MNRTLRIAWREYLSFLKTPGFWISLLIAPLGAALGGLAPGLMERSAPAPVLAVVDLTDGPTPVGGRLPRPRALSREAGSPLHAAIKRALQDAGDAAATAEMASRAQEAAGPAAAQAVRDAARSGGMLNAYTVLRRVAPKAARGYSPPTPTARLVSAPVAAWAAATPEAAGAALRPYLAGDKGLDGFPRLDAAAVLHGPAAHPVVDVWSRNLADRSVEGAIREAVADRMRADRLRAERLDPALLSSLDALKPEMRDFSPKAGSGAASGRVSGRDRLPIMAGFGLAFMLWALILTGAGILLNSVIEEKANRVLEVLLSSADTSEILGGKILGVAALSTTVMAVWATLGLTLLNRQSPGLAGELLSAVTHNGLIVWFALYFVVGYLMYASIFAAIGSFCETTREAQTLLGPIMILLTVPMVFLSVAIRRPDAPIIQALSWLPPFTPFLMTARASAGLPLMELLGTLALMTATAAAVVWGSARAFRAGALSTTKFDLRAGLRGVIRAARMRRSASV